MVKNDQHSSPKSMQAVEMMRQLVHCSMQLMSAAAGISIVLSNEGMNMHVHKMQPG